jgi:hypothetical protein
MTKTTRTIEGREIRFYTVNMGVERWVFSGSIHAGGYKTVEDAEVEASAQLTGRAGGGLQQDAGLPEVPKATHRRTWRTEIDPVASRY